MPACAGSDNESETSMGFLDSVRDYFRKDDGDDYYDDDYYEDGEETPAPRPTRSSNNLLGNTSRPEAESVSVYTRSGRPVSSSPSTPTYTPAETRPTRTPSFDGTYNSGTPTPGDIGVRPIARSVSGQLPPYVLRPVSYDDVQMVVRRVRTNQPVVLSFRNTNTEAAKRILDFSYGFSVGIGGSVEELGDRVFVVLPANVSLSQSDIDKLVADGDLAR